ncbi:MAG: hypothetical protein JKY53_01475 [Flavobacteriales bacterium]|nr:hypothetical protein [Flavobacteriales bacterium]
MLLALIYGISIKVNAQYWKDGYVVKTSGDTIKGPIHFKEKFQLYQYKDARGVMYEISKIQDFGYSDKDVQNKIMSKYFT